jgi:hypothetical protein
MSEDKLEQVIRVANDEEMDAIESAMIRAGLIWKCEECCYNNGPESESCESCGEAKP